MSPALVLSRLKSIVEKTENLLESEFNNLCATDDQWSALVDLSQDLLDGASRLQQDIKASQTSRRGRAREESEKHRLQAQSLKGELLKSRRLKNSAIFRRNILLIYQGPKNSAFDLYDTRLRKESTRNRCEIIRQLDPDGVISWAIAYAPSLWAGGAKASDVFDCLVDDIEPDETQVWPPVIQETLNKLGEEEAYLQGSREYGEFLKAVNNPSAQGKHQVRSRKRRRIDDHSAETGKDLHESLPMSRSQQIPGNNKSLLGDDYCSFSFMRRDMIQNLPEPFRTGVKMSNLWRKEMEREGFPVTNCLTIYLPEMANEDALFVARIGYYIGFDISDLFGLGDPIIPETHEDSP